jgi:hypothetical protein
MHSGHIEIAVAELFNFRLNIIVPNVYWGLGLKHECDMIVVSPAGFATEIEIKISRSDFKADFKKNNEKYGSGDLKGWGHYSSKIKKFYYAVPHDLNIEDLLPPRTGLIKVYNFHRAKIIYPAKVNHEARRLNKDEIDKLLHLGCMRIWSLKQSLYNK